MITGEDIDRMIEEEKNQKTKLLVIDTMQFFEIEVPMDVDPDWFLSTQACADICADKIKGGMTDLNLDRVITEKDEHGEWKT